MGWAALAASVGVVLAATAIEAAAGPVAAQSAWPTDRLWRYYFTTIGMATCATILSVALALPAVIALVQVRRPWQRGALVGLIVLPLLTMPGTFAYAWMLLATRRDGWAAVLLDAVGWNRPGAAPIQAAWVLATWLWPIPALILAASFVRIGRGGYQLARLDASALWAFVRGAIPLMRGPLLAAMGIVFILSATDSTIPPLMSATEVWSVETLAAAGIAQASARPIGFLFWQNWPILATVAVVAAAAAPGLRRMASWADEPVVEGGATPGAAGQRWWMAAALLAAMMTVFPILVFGLELAGGRTTPAESVAVAFRTFQRDGLATLGAAAIAGACAGCIALTCITDRNASAHRRAAARVVLGSVVVCAILPPELIGTALASFLTRISDPTRWNVYDCTPWAWSAALVARFGFLPVVVTWLLNRRVSSELTDQAGADGATPLETLTYVRLPELARPLAAAALIAACLGLSEVSASALVQPPRFFGGSLAVKVDAQMHYGRQNETIATTLLLMAPAVLGALIAPMLARSPAGRRRRRRVDVSPADRGLGTTGKGRT